jgi:hypothetical protein
VVQVAPVPQELHHWGQLILVAQEALVVQEEILLQVAKLSTALVAVVAVAVVLQL